MSNDEPEIYLYDIHKANLVKTIRFHKEDHDGVGPKAGGFFMAGFNEIYLPSLYVPEISKIDSPRCKDNYYFEALQIGDLLLCM